MTSREIHLRRRHLYIVEFLEPHRSVGAHHLAGVLFVADERLDLGLVASHAEVGLLLLPLHLRDRLLHALCALALEAPAARELDAAPAARDARVLALGRGDVDPGHRELVALLDRARRDEVELVRAVREDGLRVRVARVRGLKWVWLFMSGVRCTGQTGRELT